MPYFRLSIVCLKNLILFTILRYPLVIFMLLLNTNGSKNHAAVPIVAHAGLPEVAIALPRWTRGCQIVQFITNDFDGLRRRADVAVVGDFRAFVDAEGE